MAAGPAFLTAWRATLPVRWRGLVVPYGQALGVFIVSYAGITALFRPWALGYWWSFGVSFAAGFGVCWWLWQPWALLARNYKGESRRLPLMLVWLLCTGVGWTLREYLHARLGPVRSINSVRELAQPGEAVFFQIQGSAYPDKPHAGHYPTQKMTREKNGTQRYTATCYYACPLLADNTDTTTTKALPPAWLCYIYQTHLGDDLTPGELNWRYQNFVARSDARFDSLNLRDFSYLVRDEHPDQGLYLAAAASHLASGQNPLLLTPVRASFAERGNRVGRWLLRLTLGGSLFITFFLLTMPLRDPGWLLLQEPLPPA